MRVIAGAGAGRRWREAYSGIEVDVLPFDGAPKAFDEGIVGGAAPAIAADAAAGDQQGLLIG